MRAGSARQAGWAWLALLLGVAATGCVREADSADTTLTIAYGGDERMLSPAWDTQAKFLVFLPMLELDETGRPVGVLARSWETDAAHRRWTFHLRTDVRWHDGVPVTAHDVAFTVGLYTHPAVLQWRPTMVEEILVPNDSTVVITLDHTSDPVQFWTWYVFFPRHLLEGLDTAEYFTWEFWTRPVGNGPFRYVRHLPRTMIELEANPEHWQGRPAIDRVVLRFLPGSGVTELLAGTVDVVGATPIEVAKLATDSRFATYFALHGYQAYTIFWRHTHGPFGDARVRRALTLALDRATLLGALYLPPEVVPVIDGIYSQGMLMRGELVAPLPHAPASARALLAAAGWRDTDGDGVVDRDGRALRFTALVSNQPSGLEDLAVLIREQLRRVGVLMELQPLEAQAFRARMRAGAFEAAIGVMGNAPPSPVTWFGEDSPLGYRNANAAGLALALAATGDLDERDRLYTELSHILREEQPVTRLFPLVSATVAHRRVRGLTTPHRTDPAWHADRLWIEGL